MQPELSALWETLRRLGAHQPGRVALHGDGLVCHYGQLLHEVERREEWLRAEPPGVFALALENGPEALLWDLAALLAGRPCVILPPFFTPAQRAHCLEQTGATLLLADGDMAEELAGLGFAADPPFWRRPQRGDAVLPAGTAKITYTSGSTGAPKGVCLSAQALLRVAYEVELASRPAEPQRYLAVLPLAVLLENLGIYAALLAGAEIVLLPQERLGIGGASSVDWPRLLDCIALSGAQSLILVPQLLLGLVTAIERGQMQVGPLRFVAVGGAHVSPELLARAAQVGLPVYEGYGLSECASVVCLNRPGANRPGSVGQPLPHVQVRLAEDSEVLVSGSVALGYLGEAPFDGEWWPTGDVGRFDEDGYLYLGGRKKNQFITSFGRNVNPEWVEAELTQNGVILQAFVHGEGLHQNLALLWPLDPQCADATLAAAVEQANRNLPDYAQIHAWRRLPQPFDLASGTLTANGRPRRAAILERYRNELSALVTE
ncbi:AMP-binding protein [Pseudomonas schmalbachii]|uniref:AMP-binding protein n=1 Tax=Pseudomonas schmalbachii TaxID=2816993 RepID=A0ABS3TVL6_9PSED|nr:AMP-binding protein [Pseudomonas schmalbachii]MBO3277683.1 AMP-binding protein [Pseudomonas schmalbachii]